MLEIDHKNERDEIILDKKKTTFFLLKAILDIN